MSDQAVGRPARGEAAPGAAVIPGFELLDVVGHGATTVVHRARRMGSDGPDVAVKSLREPTDDPAVAGMFRREAALIARVVHPALATVHAVGEAGGRPYLVLELVDGVALADLIDDDGMPPDRIIDVAIDTAGALDAVHRMRLVHRDVKPQNLLVTAAGRAKLIDFDLATWAGQLAPADMVTGTLAYSAPEQTGMLARPVDGRTDLYALGVVLFECVVGRPPFAADDVGELLRLHATAAAPDVRSLQPRCPPALAAVVAKLLAKDPDDRYQSARGLLADLRRLRERPEQWPFALDGAGEHTGAADGVGGGVGGHGADGARGGGDAAAAAGPSLVGRHAELSNLLSRWRGCDQLGAAVLVEGAAGTGKTALTAALIAAAARDGGVLRCRGVADGRQPLGTIAAAVRRHIEAVRRLPIAQRYAAQQRVRQLAGAAAPLLAALSPTVADVLDADAALLAESGHHEQVPTALAGFIAALARRDGRLLLVVDDPRDLDETSARVLAQLRRERDGMPLLMVLTSPPDSRAALEDRLGAAFDAHIELSALPPAAVTELIARELGGADVPAGVSAQLAARTGGNPFAILEYLRHLIEAGGLQPSWGTWRLDGDLLDRLHLPSDVLDLVLARLEGLTPGARRLLAAAAVQGLRFDAGVLAASTRRAGAGQGAAGAEPGGGQGAAGAGLGAAGAAAPGDGSAIPGDVAAAIAAALRGRVVEHVDGDVYAFVHRGLRDALLRDLDAPSIADLHHRIAEALDARPPAGPEDVYALARHRVAAGVDAAARSTLGACAAAGRSALAQHAPADAATFLTAGARAAAVAGITVGVRFRQDLATALLRAGRFTEASVQINDALAVERDPLRRADLLNVLATAEYSAGDGEAAVATVRRGLAELDAALSRRPQAARARTGDAAPARRRFGAAVPDRPLPLAVTTIARFVAGLLLGLSRGRAGAAIGLRRQCALLEAVLLETGIYAASAAVDDRLVAVFLLRGLLPANRIGPSPQRARVLAGVGYLAAVARLPRLGLRIGEAALRDAAEIGDPTLVASTAWLHGVVGAVAHKVTAPVIAALEAHGRWLDLPFYLAAVAGIVPHLISEGHTAAAETWISRARARLQAGGAARDAFPVECMAGAVQAVRGRGADADATLRAAVAAVPAVTTQHRMQLAWSQLIVLVEQGEVGAALDDVIADIDAARMPARNDHVQGIRLTVAYGRLAQAQAATGAERDRRLAQAWVAIRALRGARAAPRLSAGRLACRAWALHLANRDQAALRMVHRALRAADGANAPLLLFDVLVVYARVLHALGLVPEARRQAAAAHLLADEHGWVYRARAVRAEFGIRPGGDGASRGGRSTRSMTRSSVTRSSGHSDIHQRRRLEAVTQISATAASVLDPEALIKVALEVTLRLLSAERIFMFVARTDPDSGAVSLVPHSGYDADHHLTELVHYSSTLVERVWETGEALVVTGTEEGAALGSESAVVHGLRSILVAPLQVKGQVHGVVYLDSRVARGIFTSEDVDLLIAICQQVAAALETARAAQLEVAVRAATRQRDLAEALRASMADLNATLDPDEVLQRLLRIVASRLPGDRVALLQRVDGRVRLIALDDDDEEAATAGTAPPPGDHPALDALVTTATPVTGGGGGVELPDHVAAVLARPRSWLAIPLRLRDESAGVIVVGSPDRDGYAAVDVEVAAALAEQGAVAYENACLFSRVEELATTDGLTGLATRHHFWELARRELERARRDRRALAAVMLDIDHFKAVNDTHGHAVGDAVLREVARRLRVTVREVDVVGRYGGEEFALILPGGDDAMVLAERLRTAVAGSAVTAGDVVRTVTVSVGVSFLRDGDDLDALFSRADAALYASKAAGRDRITVA